MSEQAGVQVREGVWLTRDGEHVEVRARDMTGNESSEWRWEGRLKNYLAAWRNDGALSVSGGESNGDLVQFLRALPGAEPAPEPAPEPQPVHVREGWWNLRDGRQVKVWRDTSNERRPWFGEHGGIRFSWMADGRYHAGTNSPADLVEHVGQLPEAEPQPVPEPAPEPQPVHVREGIWKTRSGHEVEVRENSGQLAIDFPWRGALFGVMEIWRDNGQWLNNATCDHRDLVAYVGPLPQQTTTDTLAEIEEQVADVEQQDETCRLQAELAQATAARDSLEQQLATMTYERDILAQRLVTKPSEESLQKEVSRKQIEINTLKDKLQDMTDDRETLRRQFVAMTADRDRVQAELAIAIESLQNERFQAQTAHAGRKRAEEDLESMTAERDRLALDVDALNQSNILLDRSCRLLTQERGSAIEECDRARLHIDKLQAELRQAQIDLDAERETPAANYRAVVDAHLIGAQTGRQAAFEAVGRWLEPLAGVDSEHAAAVLQALPGCIRKLAEL